MRLVPNRRRADLRESTCRCGAQSPAIFPIGAHEFDLVIDMKTAKALGLTIPQPFSPVVTR